MSAYQYTTNVGDYLVIWITAMTGTYIAEITQSEPLRMKVEETGPFARLRHGDFIIREADTEQFQKDCENNTNIFLQSEQNAGRKVFSGLKSIDVNDDTLHKILPDTYNN